MRALICSHNFLVVVTGDHYLRLKFSTNRNARSFLCDRYLQVIRSEAIICGQYLNAIVMPGQYLMPFPVADFSARNKCKDMKSQ